MFDFPLPPPAEEEELEPVPPRVIMAPPHASSNHQSKNISITTKEIKDPKNDPDFLPNRNKKTPGDAWYDNTPKPVVDLTPDPWKYNYEFQYIVYSHISTKDYEVAHVGTNKKFHDSLIKIRGFARDIKEADSMAQGILGSDPFFDVQIIPIGEWRPLSLMDVADVRSTNDRVNTILQAYVNKELKNMTERKNQMNDTVIEYREKTDEERAAQEFDENVSDVVYSEDYVPIKGTRSEAVNRFFDEVNQDRMAAINPHVHLPSRPEQAVVLNPSNRSVTTRNLPQTPMVPS